METQNYIALAGKEISISVSVFLFKEENAYIAYCPSLDLSGYDATEDSAKQDFEYVLREWLREQMDNGTLYRDLAKHGWKVGQLYLRAEEETSSFSERRCGWLKAIPNPTKAGLSIAQCRANEVSGALGRAARAHVAL